MPTNYVGEIVTVPGVGFGMSEPARRLLSAPSVHSEVTLVSSPAERKRQLKV